MKGREDLKNLFKTGMTITESNMADLINSMVNLTDDDFSSFIKEVQRIDFALVYIMNKNGMDIEGLNEALRNAGYRELDSNIMSLEE